jgi:hypothetical protein
MEKGYGYAGFIVPLFTTNGILATLLSLFFSSHSDNFFELPEI